jgi:hypothetical protein
MCAKGSAEIDYHTKLKMKTEPNKRFLYYDKGIPELLNDLDELSQRCGENAATNAQNLIIAVGKHAVRQRNNPDWWIVAFGTRFFPRSRFPLNVDRARPCTGAANFVAAIPANTTASRTRSGRAIPYALIVIVSVSVCDVFYWILHFGVVVGDACAVTVSFVVYRKPRMRYR